MKSPFVCSCILLAFCHIRQGTFCRLQDKSHDGADMLCFYSSTRSKFPTTEQLRGNIRGDGERNCGIMNHIENDDRIVPTL